MTVVVASNDDEAARRPHVTSLSIDRVEIDVDERKGQRRGGKANSKRRLPSWTKTHIPLWGTRISVPEWDDDEIIPDGKDDDNDDDDQGNDDDAGSCDYVSGREDRTDEYRINNGWEVRVVVFCFGFVAVAHTSENAMSGIE